MPCGTTFGGYETNTRFTAVASERSGLGATQVIIQQVIRRYRSQRPLTVVFQEFARSFAVGYAE